MKSFKYLLAAMLFALPFSSSFAREPQVDIIVKLPKPPKYDGDVTGVCISQIDTRKYSVTFDNYYEDVSINIYNNCNILIGSVFADYVTPGDTIIVTTRRDGAVELKVYSGLDEVYSTIL